jgi:hypothetical protein
VNKNITVNNIRYVNQAVPGAVTATSGQAFTSAQPVGRNLVAVNRREMASAPVAVRAPAVVPPKQAVLGAGAATNYHPPAVMQSRAVVAKTTPPPAPPSFAVRQAAIQKNEGQPLSIAQAREIQAAQSRTATTQAQVRIAPPAKSVNPPVTNNRVNTGQTNQPGPLGTSANRPANSAPNPVNNSMSRPATVNANQPPANTHNYNDRPPSARTNVNPQLEQRHQQQIEQLQQKQDQQYQKLQQKQEQEQQRVQQQQNQVRQQQVEQKHQQEMQALQDKQHQQQEALQQKQQVEHQKAYKEPPPNSKPAPSHEEKEKHR